MRRARARPMQGRSTSMVDLHDPAIQIFTPNRSGGSSSGSSSSFGHMALPSPSAARTAAANPEEQAIVPLSSSSWQDRFEALMAQSSDPSLAPLPFLPSSSAHLAALAQERLQHDLARSRQEHQKSFIHAFPLTEDALAFGDPSAPQVAQHRRVLVAERLARESARNQALADEAQRRLRVNPSRRRRVPVAAGMNHSSSAVSLAMNTPPLVQASELSPASSGAHSVPTTPTASGANSTTASANRTATAAAARARGARRQQSQSVQSSPSTSVPAPTASSLSSSSSSLSSTATHRRESDHQRASSGTPNTTEADRLLARQMALMELETELALIQHQIHTLANEEDSNNNNAVIVPHSSRVSESSSSSTAAASSSENAVFPSSSSSSSSSSSMPAEPVSARRRSFPSLRDHPVPSLSTSASNPNARGTSRVGASNGWQLQDFSYDSLLALDESIVRPRLSDEELAELEKQARPAVATAAGAASSVSVSAPSTPSAADLPTTPAETSASTTSAAETPECCICLSEIAQGEKEVSLICSHAFHVTCIKQWLSNNTTCPICRMEVKFAMSQRFASAAGAHVQASLAARNRRGRTSTAATAGERIVNQR